MNIRFATAGGVIYEVDYGTNTWRRLDDEFKSVMVKKFHHHTPIARGERVQFIGPPSANTGHLARIEETSLVVKVEQEPYEELR